MSGGRTRNRGRPSIYDLKTRKKKSEKGKALKLACIYRRELHADVAAQGETFPPVDVRYYCQRICAHVQCIVVTQSSHELCTAYLNDMMLSGNLAIDCPKCGCVLVFDETSILDMGKDRLTR